MEGDRQSGLPNRDWGGDLVRSLKGQEWRMPQFLHRINGIGYWVSQLGQPWKKERPHLRKPEELPPPTLSPHKGLSDQDKESEAHSSCPEIP